MGDYPLTELTTGKLQKYVALRLQGVKPKTVINEIVVLKEMFKHAVRWGYLKVSPAEYVERPRVEKEEMDILTPDEINFLLGHVTPKYRPFFLMAVLTGMRRRELLGLQWGDINWKNNQIHVRHAMWKGQFISPKSKTSIRRIDMSPYLAMELKKHMLASPFKELDHLVFCNEEGNSLDADALIRRQFLPALRRAKIRKVRFHDGLQLGGQAYSQMIFFQDKRAFDEFTSGNFEFGAQATAVAITAGASAQATTGGTGAGASGTQSHAKTAGEYQKGMAVFTVAKGGLMYEASVGGQKFDYKAKGSK